MGAMTLAWTERAAGAPGRPRSESVTTQVTSTATTPPGRKRAVSTAAFHDAHDRRRRARASRTAFSAAVVAPAGELRSDAARAASRVAAWTSAFASTILPPTT